MRQIKAKLKRIREGKIDEIVEKIERSHDSKQMFSAVKEINRKKQQIQVVYDENGKKIANEKEAQVVIEKYFKEHFYDETKPKIQPQTNNSKLDEPITVAEVR